MARGSVPIRCCRGECVLRVHLRHAVGQPCPTHSIELRTDVLILDSLDSRAAVAGLGAEDRSGEPAPLAGQGAPVAPDFEQRQFRVLGSEGPAWIQILGGLVVGLIALYSSDDHINFGSWRFSLNQQWGVVFIVASLAVVAVVAAGFCGAALKCRLLTTTRTLSG